MHHESYNYPLHTVDWRPMGGSENWAPTLNISHSPVLKGKLTIKVIRAKWLHNPSLLNASFTPLVSVKIGKNKLVSKEASADFQFNSSLSFDLKGEVEEKNIKIKAFTQGPLGTKAEIGKCIVPLSAVVQFHGLTHLHKKYAPKTGGRRYTQHMTSSLPTPVVVKTSTDDPRRSNSISDIDSASKRVLADAAVESDASEDSTSKKKASVVKQKRGSSLAFPSEFAQLLGKKGGLNTKESPTNPTDEERKQRGSDMKLTRVVGDGPLSPSASSTGGRLTGSLTAPNLSSMLDSSPGHSPLPSTPRTAPVHDQEDFAWFHLTRTGAAGGQAEAGELLLAFAFTPNNLGDLYQETSGERIEAPEATRVFGVDINEAVTKTRAVIPRVIVDTCEFLRESDHLQTEGLFRVSGNKDELVVLEAAFDRDQDVEFESPHDASGVLKRYLRRLPQPLLTFTLYDQWLAIERHDPPLDYEQKVAACTELIEELPGLYKKTLQYLLAFLVEVAQEQAHNKMTPSNLAIVFAPNLLRPEKEPATSDEYVQQNKLSQAVVTFLIESFVNIFRIQVYREVEEDAESVKSVDKESKEAVESAVSPRVKKKKAGGAPEVPAWSGDVSDIIKSSGSSRRSKSKERKLAQKEKELRLREKAMASKAAATVSKHTSAPTSSSSTPRHSGNTPRHGTGSGSSIKRDATDDKKEKSTAVTKKREATTTEDKKDKTASTPKKKELKKKSLSSASDRDKTRKASVKLRPEKK